MRVEKGKRKMKTPILVALGGCLLTRLSVAAEPTYDFECDTPPGHYSYWTRTVTHSNVKLAGTITVNEKREHERWNPTISAVFYPDGKKGGFGLQIYSISTQAREHAPSLA